MSQESIQADHSLSEFNDDISSSSDDQKTTTSNVAPSRASIKSYVTNVLAQHVKNDEQKLDLTRTRIKIDGAQHRYENVSAFRQYQSNAEGIARTNAQRRQEWDSTSADDDDDDLRLHRSSVQSSHVDESVGQLNLDPNPIVEERDGGERLYKQKVYLRQLQPPTPQPIEIQVKEVLLKPSTEKPPIHVRVGQREPRTPSPIVIKSSPPQPPATESDQPIIYNKYVPPPKQPPQQIIIHRYPDLPPKPRPIVIEQWLPYKPAPKRIIKESLPPEALRTPPPPHNLLVSYDKPRALIEVELVRLPIVKVDPQTYQQMTNGNQKQSLRTFHPADQMDWRI